MVSVTTTKNSKPISLRLKFLRSQKWIGLLQCKNIFLWFQDLNRAMLKSDYKIYLKYLHLMNS